MQRAKVLLVSDDLQAGSIWEYALKQLELDVVLLSTSWEAIEWRAANAADLIVINETARDFDGIALIRQWRPEISAPIILLTDGDHRHCLDAYAAGVDECYMEPISPDIFLAKIRAWLRHAGSVPLIALGNIERGPFCLRPATQEVELNGTDIALTNVEFRLFHVLITHPNQVIPSQILVDQVWGYSPGVEGTVLKNAIYRLRHKIEPDRTDPQYIISVSGVGYMLKL